MRSLTFSPGIPLTPGRYRRGGFEPSLSFEVPAGWLAVQDVPGFFDVELGTDALDVIAVQFARSAVDGTARAAAVELRRRRDLVVTALDRATIGGTPGHRVTVDTTNPDIEARAFVEVLRVDAGPISIASGRALQATFVDTASGLLAILVGGSVRTWDRTLAAAAPIMASVRFG